ncbi:MAG: DUF1553 domain-containing protein [Acidobacteria bacterium]|nr:DUF1553 domain-containing protein [Acidobacteriota bacterium]
MRALAIFMAAACLAAGQTIEFNRDVRPILSDRCFTCHGPDAGQRKTKLRFDQEAGAKIALTGGKQAIVPGDPAKSELYVRLVTQNKALRMPPAYMGHDALRPREIEVVRQWIEQGARWQAHWSFLPPRRVEPPAVRAASWARNGLDRLVLARLEREGLTPSAEAGKATLLRRVTLDLTGLPAAPEEVTAFLRDDSARAYEKVVDRLLGSAAYAERMAIRWLEAARYADTNGYQTDGVRDMWRWRDWVIGAFHRNMPFDQFTVEQLAGDLLPGATVDQRVATGFNRNHRTTAEGGSIDEEWRVEYVADRAETTSTVFLGLTMGCARCHDHKYDPLPQKDYYRLFAFFNNVPERGFIWNFGNEPPVVKAPTPAQEEKLTALDGTLRAAELAWEKKAAAVAREQKRWERRASGPWNITKGMVFHQQPDDPKVFEGGKPTRYGTDAAKFDYRDPITLAAWIKPSTPRGAILTRYDDYFEGSGYGLFLIDGKLRYHFIFRWTDLGMRIETAEPIALNKLQHVAVTYDGGMRASGVRIYVDGREVATKVLFDSQLWPLSHKAELRIGAGAGLDYQGEVADARIYNRALTAGEIDVLMSQEPLEALARIPAARRTGVQSEKLRMAFLDTALTPELDSVRCRLEEARTERNRYFAAIPTVMVMEERKDRRDTFVLKRGAYDAPSDEVTPGVPSAFTQLPGGTQADRLALARWIVSPENPLTARVMVNRLWQMLFGIGLVKTIEDFGSQGEWPVQPELLDWLAVEFVEKGWNVKALLKTIVMSSTYRQSSKAPAELLARDPDNRLLARGPRIRLSAEMIRDQALAVSGLLETAVGGPSVKPYQPAGLWQELAGGGGYQHGKGADLYRRSLYTYWRRTIAPPSMVTFDSPNRETCSVRETRTNTPLQALNLMNDVAFLEASRRFAERVLSTGPKDEAARLTSAMTLALSRPPSPAERGILGGALSRLKQRFADSEKAAMAYLAQGESPRNAALDARELAAWTSLCSLILNLDEMVTKE